MTDEAAPSASPTLKRWSLPAAAVLAAALGLILGWLIFAPDTPGTESVDAGFARDMSEHHAQAVEMSLIALQDSEETDIDLLAYDIATTQSTQIGTMQGWLTQWGLPSARSEQRMAWMPAGAMAGMQAEADADPGSPNYRPMPGMATPAEMEQLESAAATDAEVLFLQLMITHHLAGVDMAQAAVEGADDPHVVRLAESMVNGQRSEIDLMTELLTERGAEPRETP